MRTFPCLLVLSAAWVLHAQQTIPSIEGETLSGKKVSLPAAAGGQSVLLIIGFTHASQAQTKAWSLRVSDRVPVWSIAVLEDVPHLIRGIVMHSIKNSVPKEQYDRFLLVYHGEKRLKQAVGFDQPGDAYLLAIDSGGVIRWTLHGPVTDAGLEQIGSQFAH